MPNISGDGIISKISVSWISSSYRLLLFVHLTWLESWMCLCFCTKHTHAVWLIFVCFARIITILSLGIDVWIWRKITTKNVIRFPFSHTVMPAYAHTQHVFTENCLRSNKALCRRYLCKVLTVYRLFPDTYTAVYHLPGILSIVQIDNLFRHRANFLTTKT